MKKPIYVLADSERICGIAKSYCAYIFRNTVTVIIIDLDSDKYRKVQIDDENWINENAELINAFHIMERQLNPAIMKVVRHERAN